MMTPTPPLFVLAPRYARELGQVLRDAGREIEIVTRPAEAAAALSRSTARVAVVDLRGALAAAGIAAHEAGEVIAARHGTMLVLIARGEAGGVPTAYASGATHVLASPFSANELGSAIDLALRTADRLAAAQAGRVVRTGDTRRDLLTGLATAEHAQTWVDLLLSGDEGEASEPITVILVALARFGQINAAYGPAVADALLQGAAERLSRCVAEAAGDDGEGWLVARMGGAEFAVVLPAPVTLDTSRDVAAHVVAGFAAPFAAGGRIVHLGVRAGIAASGPEDAAAGGAARLFRRASASLARARAGAAGRIEVLDADADGDPLTRLADLEGDLRHAIARDEFAIRFQPQVTLATGCIGGVEALVRWEHPQFGELSAETLLEVAASAEFATQLGDAIRAKALREAAAWPPRLAALTLSVNVTADDLRAPGFADRLDDALDAAGFARARLLLEVTESDLIENLDEAAATLSALRDRGTRVALDDFGTGYSSLAYLKSLPLDCLKLDKRLTADLAGRPRDRVVVRGIVGMARELGIRVVAEGVETQADVELVAAARCDAYQGFYCAAPMPGRDLAAFVEDWDARAGS